MIRRISKTFTAECQLGTLAEIAIPARTRINFVSIEADCNLANINAYVFKPGHGTQSLDIRRVARMPYGIMERIEFRKNTYYVSDGWVIRLGWTKDVPGAEVDVVVEFEESEW